MIPRAAASDSSSAMGAPSSTKVRMKPPGSASASASPSSCRAASLSPWASSATACSTIALSRSSAQPLPSTCCRYAASTASAAEGSPCARSTLARLSGSSYCRASWRGGADLAQAQMDQHLQRGNLGQALHVVVLARGLLASRPACAAAAARIAAGQFHPGQAALRRQ